MSNNVSSAASIINLPPSIVTPPHTRDDKLSSKEDSVRIITAQDLLANDRVQKAKIDGITITELSTHGTLMLNGMTIVAKQKISFADLEAGKLVFIPHRNFNGEAQFKYAINVGKYTSNPSAVKIAVAAANDAPVASNDYLVAKEDVPRTISASDLFGKDGAGNLNDYDIDSAQLSSMTITSLATNGVLKLNGMAVTAGQKIALSDIDTGKLVFVPNQDFNGNANFKYTVSDGLLSSNEATVSIAVGYSPMVKLEATGVSSREDHAPQITSVGNKGEYVVTWHGQDSQGDYSIFVQKFNADGTTAGYSPIKLEASHNVKGTDQSPQIVALGATGEFAVTWHGINKNGDFSVFVQKFNADGSSAAVKPIQLDALAHGNDYDPQIAAVGMKGEFVVAWHAPDKQNDESIFVQKFNADGSTNGHQQVMLEASAAGNDYAPQISEVGDKGEFVVTWFASDASFGDFSVYVQKFDVNGNAVKSPTQLEATGVTTKEDVAPQVTSLGNTGAFVVVWQGQDKQGDNSIYIQKFNADGTLQPRLQLEAMNNATGEDERPQVTAIGNTGSYAVTWSGTDSKGDSSIFVQQINADGSKATMVQLEALGNSRGSDSAPQITQVSSKGDYVVTWQGQDSDGDRSIFVQKFNADGSTTGYRTIQLEAVNKHNGDDFYPQVSAVGNDGGFAITWAGIDSNGDSSIFVQKFFANGTTNSNNAPIAVNDTLSAQEDTKLIIQAADLFGSDGTGKNNDYDGDNTRFTSIVITTLADNGTLKLGDKAVTLGQIIAVADIQAGKLSFIGKADFSGKAGFKYTVSDGINSSNEASVTIDVKAVNDAPVAKDDIVLGKEDARTIIKPSALFTNDYDVDNSSLTSITIKQLATNGVLKLGDTAVTLNQKISYADLAAGKLSFTPNANFSGDANFKYLTSDGSLDSNIANVTIKISAVNDIAVAVDDYLVIKSNAPHVMSSAELFGKDGTGAANDRDVDNSKFSSITITSPVQNGVLQLSGVTISAGQKISIADIDAGKLIFVPNSSFQGDAAFKYTVSDGNASSNEATVHLAVGYAPRIKLDAVAGGNSFESGSQVVSLGKHGYAVVWDGESYAQGQGSRNIFIQKLNNDGSVASLSPIKLEVPAQASTTNFWHKATAIGSQGEMVVTWQNGMGNDNKGIYTQKVNADGSLGKLIHLDMDGHASEELMPQVCAVGSNGDYVVAWGSVGQHPGVHFQKFHADGSTTGFKQIDLPASDNLPAWGIATQLTSVNTDGSFVATWIGKSGLVVQKFNPDGTPLGSTVPLENPYAKITPLGSSGQYAATWIDMGTRNTSIIHVQKFNADGTITNQAHQKLEVTNQISSITSSLKLTQLNASGEEVATWLGTNANGNHALFVQKLNANTGQLIGDVTQVDSGNEIIGSVAYPQIQALGTKGDFVVVWEGNYVGSSSSIFVQKFNADGTSCPRVQLDAPKGEFETYDWTPSVSAVGDRGEFAVSWNGMNGKGEWDIYVQKFFANGSIYDNVAPVAFDDHIYSKENTTLVLTDKQLFGSDGAGKNNDYDFDKRAFSNLTITSLPNNGELKLNGSPVTLNQKILVADLSAGKLSFTPNQDFSGDVDFKYVVSDGMLNSNAATVTISVVDTSPTISSTGSYVSVEGSHLTKVGVSGEYVVAWKALNNGLWDGYVQKVNADGTTTNHPAIQLKNCDTTPEVTSLGGSGEFVAVWKVRNASGDLSVMVQKFNADGSTSVAPVELLQADPYNTVSPKVVAVGNTGEFLVAFNVGNLEMNVQDTLASIQKFNADGTTTGYTAINFKAYMQQMQIATIGNSGEFAVTWNIADVTGLDIYAQRFNANGQAACDATKLDGMPTGYANNLAQQIAALGNTGAYVIAWKVFTPDETTNINNFTLCVQKINADGTTTGNPLTKVEHSDVFAPDIVSLGNTGQFVVTSVVQNAIYVQKFNGNGAPLSDTPIILNASTETNVIETSPHVVAIGNTGEFVVCWDVYSSYVDAEQPINYVMLQRFNADGTTTGHAPVHLEVSNVVDWRYQPANSQIESLNDQGDYAVSWTEVADNGYQSLVTQKFHANGKPFSPSDVNHNDYSSGSDVVNAGIPDTQLAGGLGADTFVWNLSSVPVGTHTDKVTDFNLGETLDLRDLVSHGASLVIDNSAHTVKAEFTDNKGTHTQLIEVAFDAGVTGSHNLMDLGGGVIKLG